MTAPDIADFIDQYHRALDEFFRGDPGPAKGLYAHREDVSRDRVVTRPPVHRLQQRQIGLGYGFKQPVLFEELFVLRVANKWQMRVKNESKIARQESGAFPNFSRANQATSAAGGGELRHGSRRCALTSGYVSSPHDEKPAHGTFSVGDLPGFRSAAQKF